MKLMNTLFNQILHVLELSNKTVYEIRCQHYYEQLRVQQELNESLMMLFQELLGEQATYQEVGLYYEPQEVVALLQELLDAYEVEDFILYADLLELRLEPFLIQLQQALMPMCPIEKDALLYKKNLAVLDQKCEGLARRIRGHLLTTEEWEKHAIEYTSCGMLTMKVWRNDRSFYLASNHKPYQEAYLYAMQNRGEECEEYHVFGMGLGYHIREMLAYSNVPVVHVYVMDVIAFQVACYYVDYTFLLSEQVIVHVAENISDEMLEYKKHKRTLVFDPILRGMPSGREKELLEEYVVQVGAIRARRGLLRSNFKKNWEKNDSNVSQLRKRFEQKKIYLIGAGPSLDVNYLTLKQVSQEDLVIATSTVLRKLLNAGIVPDYCIVTDPTVEVYPQFDSLEEVMIPLLYLSTCYYKVPKYYKGKRYIILQSGVEEAEKAAREWKQPLFETGGSVMTTAMDVCIKLGAKEIVFVGLDLAYTNYYNHASETVYCSKMEGTSLRMVESIDGSMVGTVKCFDSYRHWMEDKIERTPNIRFIDATEGGAKIKGTIIQTLQDTINGLSH